MTARPRFLFSARAVTLLAAGVAGLLPSGCDRMEDQPRAEGYGESEFFADGAVAQEPPRHTVARGRARTDRPLYEGTDRGEPVAGFPIPLDRAALERGGERFNIHCAPCHGEDGYGRGMIVRRGFPAPPSFHTDRLRDAPNGRHFQVITRGHGVMYSYAARITPEDRWRIIAHLRVLQRGQHASLEDLPEAERARLLNTSPSSAEEAP